MNSYVLIVIADIFLAATLAFQKKYQRKAGTSVKARLVYTVVSGIFSALLFLAINGFTIRATWFSVAMAIAFSIVSTGYVFIGFRLMEKGNMSIYTLFLMSGGMTVPYICGVLFLNEELSFARTVGLLLIIGAIIIANVSKGKFDKKMLSLCMAVFLLNGATSMVSKLHQISFASEIVSSSDFVFLVMVSKVFISLFPLYFNKDKEKKGSEVSLPLKSTIFIIFCAAAADGISYMLQLVGAIDVPATVLYPLITGGTIILSTVSDYIVYKEKISAKQWAAVGIAFLGTLLFL